MTTSAVSLKDTLTVLTEARGFVGSAYSCTEHFVISGSVAPRWFRIATVLDQLKLHHGIAAVSTYHLGLAEKAIFKALASYQSTARILLQAQFHDTLSAARVVAVMDALELEAIATVEGLYKTGVVDVATLTSKLNLALGGYLSSVLTMTPLMSELYRATASVLNTIDISSTLNPTLVVVVVTADELDVTETSLLRMIYGGQLADKVDFLIDVIEPGNNVTTWAMNVRTGAVTEYMNYSFKSMALGPNGTHLGASDDGLFELVGVDDASTPIVADMISGLLEMTGAFLTSIKAVYLGLRGQGQFYLKLTSGDGKTYVYGVSAQSLKTTRVNVGKGLRARYFTFELISTGQDFDLASVTFLPVASTRRV